MQGVTLGVVVLISFISVLLQRKVKSRAWRAWCVWGAPCGFLIHAWIPVDLGTAIFFLPFGVIVLLSLVRLLRDAGRLFIGTWTGSDDAQRSLLRSDLRVLSRETVYCLGVLSLVPLAHWNSRRVALHQFEERLIVCEGRANTMAGAKPLQGKSTGSWSEKYDFGSIWGPKYKASSVSTETGFEMQLRFSYDERVSVRRREDGVYELFSDARRTDPVERYFSLGDVRAALLE